MALTTNLATPPAPPVGLATNPVTPLALVTTNQAAQNLPGLGTNRATPHPNRVHPATYPNRATNLLSGHLNRAGLATLNRTTDQIQVVLATLNLIIDQMPGLVTYQAPDLVTGRNLAALATYQGLNLSTGLIRSGLATPPALNQLTDHPNHMGTQILGSNQGIRLQDRSPGTGQGKVGLGLILRGLVALAGPQYRRHLVMAGIERNRNQVSVILITSAIIFSYEYSVINCDRLFHFRKYFYYLKLL